MSMTLKHQLAAACLLVCASVPAHAQIITDPSPNNSIVPAMIRLVGRSNTTGIPDGSGEFQVKVRDLASHPVPNAQIRVEFTPASTAQLCTTQAPSVSAVHCDPGLPWVAGVTGADGIWTATLMGCSTGPAPMISGGAARIYADGVLIGTPRVAILDLAGCNGAGANDLSVWLTDFASGVDPQRGDYDDNGSLGANDLSIWLGAFASGASIINCGGAVCP